MSTARAVGTDTSRSLFLRAFRSDLAASDKSSIEDIDFDFVFEKEAKEEIG
ncbi:MAG: hypothetical protein Q8P67_14080 [archaeon]|nr:hypothetical protein [archaeon]